MSVFGYFGTVQYDGATIVDIFHDYNKFYKNISQKYNMKEYSIKNSPRPELLSYQLYGSTEYYWVLLMVNEIYDPYYDWVMSDQAVFEYTQQKYANVGGPDVVAYHQSQDGEKFWNVVEDPMHPNHWYDKKDVLKRYLQFSGPLVPITNLEHELAENERRRVIKIVPPANIKTFVSDIRRQMEKSNVRSIQ